MRERAVPIPSSAKGCVFTGKSFHRWTLAFIDLASDGRSKHLERKCLDCQVRQHAAEVPDQETRELPKGLWCLGDFRWRDGALEP
jgi:hypothetical protein